MKESVFSVISNDLIAKDVYKMELTGDTSDITAAGQFVNIQLDGFFLRRPVSVCDVIDNRLTLVYKTVGAGTTVMAQLKTGTELNLLTGLGNGYDIKKAGKAPLLIGGGVGVPPLYYLCKALIKNGNAPIVILGFNSKDEVILADDFKRLGVRVIIATADGSLGARGFVTDAIKTLDTPYTYFYTCGPMPMFRALERIMLTSGQYSFEERMGCGFGACMGCTHKTKGKNKRICRDGPVLEREEIIWE